MEKIIAAAGTGLVALFTLAVGIYSKLTFVRRSEIYQADGKPVYQHATNCMDVQRNCQAMICAKIEQVKKAQVLAEQKRDAARVESERKLHEILAHVGRVEQYMQDHN